MDWDQVQDLLIGWDRFPPASIAVQHLTDLVAGVLREKGTRDG